MKAELDFFFEFMDNTPPRVYVANDNAVEHEGQMWDVTTGKLLGTCFVPGYRKQTRRTFSRYSRRARFMTHLWSYFENPGDHRLIMNMFDKILRAWKLTRNTIPRLYFLNVRVLLYLICDHLQLPPPFTKHSCLRDVARFHTQQNIFKNLCDYK